MSCARLLPMAGMPLKMLPSAMMVNDVTPVGAGAGGRQARAHSAIPNSWAGPQLRAPMGGRGDKSDDPLAEMHPVAAPIDLAAWSCFFETRPPSDGRNAAVC
jgi:hypothetical protein